MLNSRSEYSRCKVPRLTVDREGWTNCKKVVVLPQGIAEGQDAPQPLEKEDIREAEESLGERDIKRKCSDPPSMRKSNSRKLEKLTGWG